jgi:hypothetical protein
MHRCPMAQTNRARVEYLAYTLFLQPSSLSTMEWHSRTKDKADAPYKKVEKSASIMWALFESL